MNLDPHKYESQSGDTIVYRGRQWVVVANPHDPGGGFVLHHDHLWFYANELGGHQPNWRNPGVEYSAFSHYADKGFELDDWEAVYLFACSYFKIDTTGWLDNEIAHARAVREYRDAYHALETQMFPQPADSFNPEYVGRVFYRSDVVAAELARRGIFDPDGPSGQHNKRSI